MVRIVVLGTGTGVGKSHVCARLARDLLAEDPALSVLALKPIETGIGPPLRGDPPAGTDAATLEAATPHTARARPHPYYAFVPPISPHLAAARAGARIDPNAIARWVADAETTAHSAPAPTDPRGATTSALHGLSRHITLIETAGGAFSPLAEGYTNFDLAIRLAPARLLLVAPDSLGVLHDITAARLAMVACGRPPDLTVLSQARSPDSSTGTNAAELGRLGICEVAHTFNRQASTTPTLLLRQLLEPLPAAQPSS